MKRTHKRCLCTITCSNKMATKKLAKEMGFIRRRAVVNNFVKKVSKEVQRYSYLLIMDFESTCWENDKYRTQEIIEFPAVLLNTTNGKIEAEFQFYVQPQEEPVLSMFCKELTGISQEQVDEGIPLSLCIKKFNHWLEKIEREKNIMFINADHVPEGVKAATVVTWSDWDLSVCLLYEARRKQIRTPYQLNNWIDLRATYRKFYKRKLNGLNGALQDVGITFEGREHSGLHDSRNTAHLAWRMIKDGCIMNITRSLNGSDVEPSVLKLNQYPQPTEIPKRKQETHIFCSDVPEKKPKSSKVHMSMSNSPAKKGLSVRNFNVSSPVKSFTNLKTKTHSPIKNFKRKNLGQDIENIKPNFEMGNLTKPLPGHQTNKYNTMKLEKWFNQSAVTVPSKSYNNQKLSPSKGSFQKPNFICGAHFQRSKSDCGNKSSGVSKNTNVNTLGTSHQTTLNFGKSNRNRTQSLPELKATAPLCNCGRRSKRRMVQKPGPNIGRFFFCCGTGSRVGDKGCGFFQWEDNSPYTRLSTSLNIRR